MSTTRPFLNVTNIVDTNKVETLALQAGYICPLQDQSLLQADGDDAASFLHNQLSNDVERLGMGEARYAAYCTPKGRMLASFLYWKTASNIVLQCATSLQPTLQKRLQMFVMRAKVKLEDVTEHYAIFGLSGPQAECFLLAHFPQLPTSINDKVSSAAGSLIRVHDAFEMARYQWIVPKQDYTNLAQQLPKELLRADASLWRLGNIYAGLPQVVEQTKEKFVPQMINFELVGGVNFKKGCYPGQEIVARSQYLGKLKRRMAIATVKVATTATVELATEIFSDNDPSQPCGMIVSAERSAHDEFACLVEIKLADQEAEKVHLGSYDGPVLQFLPLPYAYLDVTE